MVGYWGEFEFEVNGNKIFTFDGFGRKSSIDIEEQDLEGQKKSIYIKGENPEEIGLTLNLKANLGIDVKNEIDRLMNSMYSKTPQNFIIGNKPLGKNKWLLTSVDENETVLDNGGNYISSKITLSFKEYARGGSKKEEKAKKEKGAVAGGVTDKLEGTRYNVNAEKSKEEVKREPGAFAFPTIARTTPTVFKLGG